MKYNVFRAILALLLWPLVILAFILMILSALVIKMLQMIKPEWFRLPEER